MPGHQGRLETQVQILPSQLYRSMIESITVKHDNVEVVSLIWQNGEMVEVLVDTGYNVIPGVNDLIITYTDDPMINPITGRLVATCLIVDNSVTSIVLNSSGYEVVAINSDGKLKVQDLTDFYDKISTYTRIEETWTRSHQG